jgi:hypothetical protein
MIKKRYIILPLLIICICLVFFFTVNYMSVKRVGTITINTKELESGYPVITFNGKKGESIEVTFDSSVSRGEWFLQLVDSDSRVLHTFETDKSTNENFEIPEDGEYRLEADYKDFIGKVRIKAKLK